VDRQQLGSHPVDPETDSHHSIEPVRTLEMQNFDCSGGPSLQHRQVLQVAIAGTEGRPLPAHLQGMPRPLPVDQERVWPRR